jgi:hypothetical protein
VYRRARVDKGFDPLTGIASLKPHTSLGDSVEDVKEIVYHPFREYLRSAIDLAQLAAQGGGVISRGFHHKGEALPPEKVEELLDITFEPYFENVALMGTVASVVKFIQTLEVVGTAETDGPMTDYSCRWTLNSKYRGVNLTTASDEGRLIIDSSMRTR